MIVINSLVKVIDAWNPHHPPQLGILKENCIKGNHRGKYQIILPDGTIVLRNFFEIVEVK